jgi:flavin-dependent dehydrogenase
MSKEVAVFGSGPAGIAAAIELAKLGNSVTQYIPSGETPPRRSVYSTSKGPSAAAMEKYCLPEHRLPLNEMRVVTPRTDFSVPMGGGFFMIDFPKFAQDWAWVIANDPRIKVQERTLQELLEMGIVEDDHRVEVTFTSGSQEYSAVIDATGVGQHIVRKAEKKPQENNPLVEYVYAGLYYGELKPEAMTLVWDPTGGTSWINPSVYRGPNGEPLIDIVYSAWGWNSYYPRFLKEADRRLKTLVEFAKTIPGVRLRSDVPLEVVPGRIVSHPMYETSTKLVYPVGESLYVAKPTSGESFNRSLLSGSITAQGISTGMTPQQVRERMRSMYPNDDFLFALTLSRLRSQLENNTGGLMDRIGAWLRQGRANENFINDMEKFIIHGVTPPRLMMRFVTDPLFLQATIETIIAHLRVKIFGFSSIKPYWTLADVE